MIKITHSKMDSGVQGKAWMMARGETGKEERCRKMFERSISLQVAARAHRRFLDALLLRSRSAAGSSSSAPST